MDGLFGHVFGRRAESELGQPGLADRDGPGGEELFREIAVGLCGDRGEGGAALLGGEAGAVGVVLDRGGDTGKDALGGAVASGEGTVEIGAGQAVQLALNRLCPGDRRLHDFPRGHLARFDPGGDAGGVEIAQGVVGEGVDGGVRGHGDPCQAEALRSSVQHIGRTTPEWRYLWIAVSATENRHSLLGCLWRLLEHALRNELLGDELLRAQLLEVRDHRVNGVVEYIVEHVLCPSVTAFFELLTPSTLSTVLASFNENH